ncbi:MAG: pyridoxamine 5'-phosphate oxidase family protein [Theionarchaea archaeon]|nr:MAG: hypothetical protein AYK19_13355 [Theionarchaea archaeon DG-70-1]MBU7026405.1 pyridoxamine 5'-phosphate oxidase family protein [Theionarchaea archaeon]
MKDEVHKPQERHWRTASELPQEVFEAWRKPNRAINPIAVVATVDPDGTPRTAPFGSLRAVTPRLLRLISWRGHDTYTNLCRDGRVTVTLITPPDMAVSVRGRARVVRKQMNADEHYAVVDIDVEEVKNDMVRTVVIESAITVSVPDEYQGWFEASLGEVEEM